MDNCLHPHELTPNYLWQIREKAWNHSAELWIIVRTPSGQHLTIHENYVRKLEIIEVNHG